MKIFTFLFLSFSSCLALSGCQTVQLDQVENHVTIMTPQGQGPFPVVIMSQGTGGKSPREHYWAFWLMDLGVATAVVDNAGIRGRTINPSGSKYTEDSALVWDILKADERIDTNRFALMGFSRGGGMALHAGKHFGDMRSLPDMVFALYPGGFGRAECTSNHADTTDVHIFFGDKDDVAQADQLFGACRAQARRKNNVSYHEFKGATHGYDDGRSFTFTCCSPTTTVQVSPSEGAILSTKAIIERAVKERWK